MDYELKIANASVVLEGMCEILLVPQYNSARRRDKDNKGDGEAIDANY